MAAKYILVSNVRKSVETTYTAVWFSLRWNVHGKRKGINMLVVLKCKSTELLLFGIFTNYGNDNNEKKNITTQYNYLETRFFFIRSFSVLLIYGL